MLTDDKTRSFLAETSCSHLVRRFGHGGLVLSTVPQPGESLQGFVGRCLALNGYRDLAAFDRILGHRRKLGSSRWSDREIADLERATGVAECVLAQACRTYEEHGRSWIASYGAVVPISHVSLGARRISSESLRRSPYHRAAWTLRAMPICPESRELLLENCPGCGSRLDWSGFIGVCRCPICAQNGERIDLRDLPPRSAKPKDGEAIDFLASFLGHDPDRRRKAISMLPSELSCLNNREIYIVGYLMAALLMSRHNPELGVGHGLTGRTKNWGLSEAELMGRQLLNWPESFFELCEHSRSKIEHRKRRYGPNKELGPVWKLTRGDAWSGIPPSLPKIFLEVAHTELGRSTEGVLPMHRAAGFPRSAETITQRDARKLIGKINDDTYLADVPRLGLEMGRGGRLQREVVERIALEVRDAVPGYRFARMIGVPAPYGEFAGRLLGMTRLCDGAEPIPSRDLVGSSVRSLMADFEDSTSAVRSEAGWKPLWMSMRRMPEGRIATILGLGLVRDGLLRAAKIGSTVDPLHLFVNGTEAKERVSVSWLDRIAKFDNGEEETEISEHYLQFLLACGRPLFDALRHAGIIDPRRAAPRPSMRAGKRMMLDPAAVRRLRSRHATMGEFTLLIPRARRNPLAWAKKLRIPISLRLEGAERSNVLLDREAMMERIREWARENPGA